MKLFIIAFHDREIEPYATMYEEIAKANNIDYDIFIWDRFNNGDLEVLENEYVFHKICTMGGKKLKKIPALISFRNIVKKIIKMNEYEKIIVLNTLPGVLLADLLLLRYENKYIYDIRDYTYEKYKLYKLVVRQLIKKSNFTTISSLGFKSFLGNDCDLIINHNISNVASKCIHTTMKDRKTITIGFLGTIRYYKENITLINLMKNSDKYRLMYAGRSYSGCDLPKYCKDKKITNVIFKGAFSNRNKPDLYKNIDIINAIYGNKKIEVKTALPNKLYDAIVFKKPIIVSAGTYLSDIVTKFKLGISVDVFREDVKSKLDDYMEGFDADEFENNANLLLDKVLNEQIEFKRRVKLFMISNALI